MRLVPQRSLREEILDRRDTAADDIAGALRDIRLVNRYLGGNAAILAALDPLLRDRSAHRALELLDVGTGSADLPLALLRRSRRSGGEIRITALDYDATTAEIAASACSSEPRIRVVMGDATRLPFPPRSFDVVTASMFLHHFAPYEAVRLLVEFRRVARRAVVINDLRRHWLPWGFIYLAARLTRRHPIFVHDAALSVLRGFTVAELQRLADQTGARRARVTRRWPFRLLLTLDALSIPEQA
jgi:SAM-dependent methyltransferase